MISIIISIGICTNLYCSGIQPGVREDILGGT
jgi:hypothetical protein